MALRGKTVICFLIIFAAVLTDASNVVKSSPEEEANNSARVVRHGFGIGRSRVGSRHPVLNPESQRNAQEEVPRHRRWTQLPRGLRWTRIPPSQPTLNLPTNSFHGPYLYTQFSGRLCFWRNYYRGRLFLYSRLFCTCQCPQQPPNTTSTTPSSVEPDLVDRFGEDKTPHVNPEDYYNTKTGISLEPVKPIRPITVDVPSPQHTYDDDERQRIHFPKN